MCTAGSDQYYSLRGHNARPGGLHASLYHAFLVSTVVFEV